METEYGIDDIFDGLLHFFARGRISEKMKKDARAKSEKVERTHGDKVIPFLVTEQNTATSLYHREVPLPW